MADDEKNGNDWEVISLTASAYAAAPGPKPFDPALETKKDLNKDEHIASAEMFMSDDFRFPPCEHKDLLNEPDCIEIHNEHVSDEERSGAIESDEYNSKLKTDGGLQGLQLFDEGNALEELKVVGEERHIYADTSFSVFAVKTDVSQRVICNVSAGSSEPNDPSDYSNVSKTNEDNLPNESGLPCKAWWKRHAVSVYNHAKEASTFWSVVVAAAVMGFAILGQQWQREKLQLQRKCFTISDESMSHMLGPLSRFKEILVGGHDRNLLIRGAAASNH